MEILKRIIKGLMMSKEDLEVDWDKLEAAERELKNNVI